MSEEIAQAIGDIETVPQLRHALDVAMTENELRHAALARAESQLGAAHAEIARLTEALQHAARMKTIIGARRIIADALEEER